MNWVVNFITDYVAGWIIDRGGWVSVCFTVKKGANSVRLVNGNLRLKKKEVFKAFNYNNIINTCTAKLNLYSTILELCIIVQAYYTPHNMFLLMFLTHQVSQYVLGFFYQRNST